LRWDLSGHLVALARIAEPAPDMPQAFQDEWHKALNLEYPYSSTVHVESIQAVIATAVPGGSNDLRYKLPSSAPLTSSRAQ
jgi:hypothetical protein